MHIQEEDAFNALKYNALKALQKQNKPLTLNIIQVMILYIDEQQ